MMQSQVEHSGIVPATIIEKIQKPSWTVVCNKETTKEKETTNTQRRLFQERLRIRNAAQFFIGFMEG